GGGGGALVVYNGDSGERVTVDLPASRWTATGRSPRYRYRDKSGAVQEVLVSADRLSVRAGGALWGYTLDEPRQGAIAVGLQLGTATPWCAEAAARLTGRPPTSAGSDGVDKFSAEPKAAPPEQCPLLGSASAAFLD